MIRTRARPIDNRDTEGLASRTRSTRKARWRESIATELKDGHLGVLVGTGSGLFFGCVVASQAGWSWAWCLPIATLVGAAAGYVLGPRLALLLLPPI